MDRVVLVSNFQGRSDADVSTRATYPGCGGLWHLGLVPV